MWCERSRIRKRDIGTERTQRSNVHHLASWEVGGISVLGYWILFRETSMSISVIIRDNQDKETPWEWLCTPYYWDRIKLTLVYGHSSSLLRRWWVWRMVVPRTSIPVFIVTENSVPLTGRTTTTLCHGSITLVVQDLGFPSLCRPELLSTVPSPPVRFFPVSLSLLPSLSGPSRDTCRPRLCTQTGSKNSHSSPSFPPSH